MIKDNYKGRDRREFIRLDYVTPLACKVCKKKTISKLIQGYTVDISKSGLLCNIRERVKKNDILWLSFNKATLSICEDLERRSFIYQNGIIGKVVRARNRKDGSCNIGVQFMTREEQGIANIHPKIYFQEKKEK